MRGAIAQSRWSSEPETTVCEKHGGKIMSPCGTSVNANHWQGCFSVFTHGFYPNFFADCSSSPVTPKLTFLPVSQGNLRPKFLLHYEVHVGKLFIVPMCSSLQSSGDFHADYEKLGLSLGR